MYDVILCLFQKLDLELQLKFIRLFTFILYLMQLYTNYLLNESEGLYAKYQTEVFSNNRAFEVNKYYIVWHLKTTATLYLETLYFADPVLQLINQLIN